MSQLDMSLEGWKRRMTPESEAYRLFISCKGGGLRLSGDSRGVGKRRLKFTANYESNMILPRQMQGNLNI